MWLRPKTVNAQVRSACLQNTLLTNIRPIRAEDELLMSYRLYRGISEHSQECEVPVYVCVNMRVEAR